MAWDWGGFGGGAASGASLGSYGGRWGAAAGGVIGGVGGGLGLFGGGQKRPSIDISGELAKIRALYDQQATALKADSKYRLGETNKATSSQLAGRGIYSSPVSEYSFNANSNAANSDLTRALASLYGGQAQTESGLLGSLASAKAQQDQLDYQQQMQSRNQLFSILGGAGNLRNMFGGGGAGGAGGIAGIGGGGPQSMGPWANGGGYGGFNNGGGYGGSLFNQGFWQR